MEFFQAQASKQIYGDRVPHGATTHNMHYYNPERSAGIVYCQHKFLIWIHEVTVTDINMALPLIMALCGTAIQSLRKNSLQTYAGIK